MVKTAEFLTTKSLFNIGDIVVRKGITGNRTVIGVQPSSVHFEGKRGWTYCLAGEFLPENGSPWISEQSLTKVE